MMVNVCYYACGFDVFFDGGEVLPTHKLLVYIYECVPTCSHISFEFNDLTTSTLMCGLSLNSSPWFTNNSILRMTPKHQKP